MNWIQFAGAVLYTLACCYWAAEGDDIMYLGDRGYKHNEYDWSLL